MDVGDKGLGETVAKQGTECVPRSCIIFENQSRFETATTEEFTTGNWYIPSGQTQYNQVTIWSYLEPAGHIMFQPVKPVSVGQIINILVTSDQADYTQPWLHHEPSGHIWSHLVTLGTTWYRLVTLGTTWYRLVTPVLSGHTFQPIMEQYAEICEADP